MLPVRDLVETVVESGSWTQLRSPTILEGDDRCPTSIVPQRIHC